ncbi:MAG: hypothetical protein ACYCS3_12290 [Acidithiobacillus sp.]
MDLHKIFDYRECFLDPRLVSMFEVFRRWEQVMDLQRNVINTASVDFIHYDDDLEVRAFNAAFNQLGLRFQWNATTFNELSKFQSEKAGVLSFIQSNQPHLFKAYNPDFLCELICTIKESYIKNKS